ncbi:MAG TPA: hypothetical protein VF503_14885 [Sphingobium sp.]|uniref:hypothetical protein n=1 Tax=Sphingobium sp. TaxID=1912891 RepID=UPI002ED45566
MSAAVAPPRLGPLYTPEVIRTLARCTGAIAALDARISVSPVAKPWRIRAAWSGYTTALQLQGVEVDEIDVYSWGCGFKVPGRPLISTTLDPFDGFAAWQQALDSQHGAAWRDPLPTAIGERHDAREHALLIRALDLVRQYARLDASAKPWLWTPVMLSGLGLTSAPLPCLTAGAKAFRLKRTPADTDWVGVFNALSRAAEQGIERLGELERQHRRGLQATLDAHRPGALPRLLALSALRPLLSPQAVADTLGLSVAGASKVIDRAVSQNLLVEITTRKSWRQFLTPDLAVTFGFIAPARGRPRTDVAALPVTSTLSAALEMFDQEMEAIDRLLAGKA